MENIFIKFQSAFIVAACAIFIIAGICTWRYIINRALKKFVIPLLKNKGLVFVRYKWVGPFGTGDFEENTIVIRPSMSFGGLYVSIYMYIYYYSELNVKNRITVRIDTLFLFIKKVVFSEEL
jgi:CDP-diglyceride synthetase